MLLWKRAIWDPDYKQIFCLLFAEKLSYKVCDESLAELDKLSQGVKGNLVILHNMKLLLDPCNCNLTHYFKVLSY